MKDVTAIDQRLARAAGFVQSGDKFRALEEIRDARNMLKEPPKPDTDYDGE